MLIYEILFFVVGWVMFYDTLNVEKLQVSRTLPYTFLCRLVAVAVGHFVFICCLLC